MSMLVPVAVASRLTLAAFAQPAITQQPPRYEVRPQATNPTIGHAGLQHSTSRRNQT